MLDDDTCYFLAVDFDEEDFKESVNIFVNECALYNLDCLVEISRSGNGAHVWFFFDNKYPAIKIRKIISSILTTAMLKSGKISFSSYDRMFPSQDKLLKNGIGNLIALPLNGKSGKNNTTVFVNKEFIPYDNQFEILKNTKKISTLYLDELYKKGFYLLNGYVENESHVFLSFDCMKDAKNEKQVLGVYDKNTQKGKICEVPSSTLFMGNLKDNVLYLMVSDDLIENQLPDIKKTKDTDIFILKVML